MAKYERRLQGEFDRVLNILHDGILRGSMSATYEDGSNYGAGDVRCAVRVYERYSYIGGNRVSLNLTLLVTEQTCSSPLSPRVEVKRCFLRLTLGERKHF